MKRDCIQKGSFCQSVVLAEAHWPLIGQQAAPEPLRMRGAPENMATSTEGSETSESFLRKRRGAPLISESHTNDKSSETVQDEDLSKYAKKVDVSLQTGTYWLTRIVLLRAIAFIYCKFDSCVHDAVARRCGIVFDIFI